MAYDKAEFPFGILDVAELLHLKARRNSGSSIYTDCPFCGDKRGKFNINYEKNVWRCNYCGMSGGMLDLYAKAQGLQRSEAYLEICEALNTDFDVPERQVKRKEPPAAAVQSSLASIQELHRTYTQLLSMLTLSDKHREHLRTVRGLSDKRIEELAYKSTPPQSLCRQLTEKLIAQGCKVQGVPGFYIDKDDKWTVKFHQLTSGILIPVRGVDGLIRGLQIRLDNPIKDKNGKEEKEGTKYLSLSSVNKKMGVSCSGLIHFVGDPNAKTVYITEGALKADIANFLMDRTFIATIGASNLRPLDPMLAMLAENGTELIIEANDMDKYRNEAIAGSASKIYLMVRSYRMNCRRLTWNPNYKGIDDWQLAIRRRELKLREERQLCYKQRYLHGLCSTGDIGYSIEKWHDGAGEERTLIEYLGLTQEEYEIFLKGGNQALEAELQKQRHIQNYRIYQLDFEEQTKTKPFAFLGIDALYQAGYKQPPAAEYRLVCDAEMLFPVDVDEKDKLQRIFEKYNDKLPEGYPGRSLSPSDVVELYDENSRTYYYRDKEGFIRTAFSPMLAKPIKP